MTQSPSVIAAASALAEWARERRSTWTEEPLPVAAPPMRAAAPPVPAIAPPVFAFAPPVLAVAPPLLATAVELDEPVEEELIDSVEELVESEPAPFEPAILTIAETVASGPSAFETITEGLKTAALSAATAAQRAAGLLGAIAVAALERLEPLGAPALAWLLRGGAIVSTLSVLVVIGLNSGRLFSGWDRVAAMVITATNRPPSTPPAPAPPPRGSGRLTVESLNGAAQVLVDGAPHGVAPVEIDLPAGPHRVLLRSEKGSVERAVRIQAGEPSEIKEAIFPGWIALTAPIDLSLSEGGHPLRRDERGWAILPPGPHDIHLDNRALGVHEVRHVVVTPGDTTRLSFSPLASTLSLTTNEPAEIWIDGTSFGQSPLVDQPIALGLHDVRIRSVLHERWLRLRATVQPVAVNVDLTAR